MCEWERANQLPEQRRKIYIMSRFENKSSADIAAQLGISSPYGGKPLVYQSERNP